MRRLLFSWISLPLLWPQLSLDLKPEALFRLNWGSTGNLGTAGISLQANTTAAQFELQGKGAVWVDLEPQANLLEGYLDARLEPYRVVVGKWARYSNPEDQTPFGLDGAWGIYGSYAAPEPVGYLSLEAAYLWGNRVYLGGRSGGFSAGAFLGGSGFIPRLGVAGAALASSVAYTLTALVVLSVFRQVTGLPWATVVIPRAEDWHDMLALMARGRRYLERRMAGLRPEV
ncbi:MAG: hypothetical protein K6T35_12205 [Meiothermus silvanus]|nr:hypothetical protein [Allomeiothermus silvanus]